MKSLIIVESPTKARTIQKFLDKEYSVVSSYGHIRDLPKKELGIDVENNFEPKYVVPLTARKRLAPIKKQLEKAKDVILATDEDREGEAIAWHLTKALGLNESHQPSVVSRQLKEKMLKEPKAESRKPKTTIERIVFHEITKQAIEEALKNPRGIDMDLVDAQQARRILDRLVGYKLSPFLWQKVARGLSAGRVQSVAVRLIVEREREIQNFKPQEYWSIEALLKQPTANNQQPTAEFLASLIKKEGKLIGKFDIKTKEGADKIVKDLEGAQYQVASIEKKETKRNPLPPFTTSTLQQAAGQKLRFSAKQTMMLAQDLYENGLITYHRTDSLNLASQALWAAKDFIIKNYAQNYWAGYLRQFKTKSKNAQEAHEAIRPTYLQNTPETVRDKLKSSKNTSQAQRLYDLIWRRFLASQMSPAVFDSTVVDITARHAALIRQPAEKNLKDSSGAWRHQDENCVFTFRAAGQILKFDGFLKVYPIKFAETDLPALERNEILELIRLMPNQHFTQPPSRYSEATLIKTLEGHGIGRPSTYAPTISTIQERNYVQKDQNRKLFPTEIGFTVNDMLVAHFPEIVDLEFTAHMEEDLDEIAAGKKQWVPVVRDFHDPFSQRLTQKYNEVEKQKPPAEPTDKICPKCGKALVIRTSRFGKFYACSGFPECRYTENIQNSIGVACPKCFSAELAEKRTKRGKIFYGCPRYPECDFALWHKPTGERCPSCGSLLVLGPKDKIRCSNKECKHETVERDRP